MGEPTIRFSFSDAPLEGFVSSVDRVLKRYPEMKGFLATNAPMTGFPDVRRLSSAMSGEAAAFSTIHSIAAGIPRSFPFHNATIHLHAPAFGDLILGASKIGDAIAGVMLTDSWWVNGRNRSLSAVTVMDADAGSKKLPSPPEAVAAVIEA